MTKKELIQSIKNEIKAISSTFREHKKAYRKHQSNTAKGLPSSLTEYSFSYESKFTKYLGGFDSIKCHLTCLHIVYNTLRGKPIHCHNDERNAYYVQNFKGFMERAQSQLTEEQDANVSCTSPS